MCILQFPIVFFIFRDKYFNVLFCTYVVRKSYYDYPIGPIICLFIYNNNVLWWPQYPKTMIQLQNK